MIPELKTYNYFDDGKITQSRMIPVIITEIIPFDKIDEETLEFWKEEVKEIDWVYAKETDYFIKGNLMIGRDRIEEVIFVRTINNNDGWFSMGEWGGRLDVDGSLTEYLIQRIKDEKEDDWVRLEYIGETYEIFEGLYFKKGTKSGLPKEIYEANKERYKEWKVI